MMLTFTIENVTNLPDGGPLSFSVSGKRGFDLGRDTHLDWTLPDPEYVISGKHCEVRFYDEAYWLHDLSRNGTFINGSQARMVEPYRLRNGDRLVIGRYIVAVKVEGASEQPLPIAGSKPASSSEWWSSEGDIAPPIDPRDLKIHAPQPRQPDFLDWAMKPQGFMPDPDAQHEPLPGWQEDDGWISAAPPLKPQPGTPSASSPPPISPAPLAPAPQPPEPAAAPVLSANANAEAPAKNIADIIRAEAQAQNRVEAARQASQIADDGSHDDKTLARPRQPARNAEPGRTPQPVAPAALRHPASSDQASGFVQRFAEAAGIPQEALSQCDPDELAAILGGLMREISGDVMQLLRARYEAKRLARSTDQTMIEAKANNPLKFSPTPQDALAVMFGPPTAQYLNAAPAFRQAFDDLKSHQIATLSAMQGAVTMLVEDLDPAQIEADAKSEGGLGTMLSSRKARMWDTFVARWNAKAQLHENGLLGAFMFYFPQCYDRGKAD